MEVTYKDYGERKTTFLRSIGEWEVKTSPMGQYGGYHKEYVGKQGIWYEVMSPIEEEVEVETEVHGIKVKVQQSVKFLRTEFWSTKDAASRYYYEKW